ncbi:NAD-dependent epimerase/dehydratase family protein [Leucobacter musarum]|uniref:NAD-dependent epimerase/dehydratase family protein n=1 Tax=Leucobacter musarum TaxID=1930747 RepID=UPI0006A7B7CD|nr:NAD-dependent epimerase/dehydratase family protein [Leucobacter musarum]
MRIAITGGTGFVGRHLAERLDPEHTVIVSRRTGVAIDDVDALTEAFTGRDAVAHCAGINREIGDQTYERVHVDGTRAVNEAARRAGVQRIVLLSFLRARPGSESPYHETKWTAEELVRASGLEYTILKAGMIYGPGDHLVDHVSRSVRTLPVFTTVGLRERTVRPVPVADMVDVLLAALEGRIAEPTITVRGVDELRFSQAVRRIAAVAGRRIIVLPAPVWAIRGVAQLTEWLMVTPLLAKAQAQMLAEGVSEAAPPAPDAAPEIRPHRPFSDARIREALPRGRFGLSDLRVARRPRTR